VISPNAARIWRRLNTTPILIQEDLLVLISRVIKDYDTAFFGEVAHFAIALEELTGIEVLGPSANDVCGWPVQMDECESALTGNDSVLPVHEKNLFIGKHVVEKGGNGGAKRIIGTKGA